MQFNSMNAHLTSDAMERVSLWDRREGQPCNPDQRVHSAVTHVLARCAPSRPQAGSPHQHGET